MPFQSEKQRRYMHANLPEIAQRWERDYANGGITRIPFANGTLASTFFPQGNLQNIISNSSTQRDYNIGATKDLVENLPGGVVKDVLAPAAAATLSIPYDAIQAYQRMKPDSGIVGYLKALDAENPLSSAWERMIGASAPLADRLSNLNFGSSAQAATPDNITKDTQYDWEGNFRGSNRPDWWGKSYDPVRYNRNMDYIDRANYPRVAEDTSDLSGMAEVKTPTAQKFSDLDKFTGIHDPSVYDKWGTRRMAEEKMDPERTQKKGLWDTIKGNRRAWNYQPGFRESVDAYQRQGMLGDVGRGPYTITQGPMAGRNMVSMFGSNNYRNMISKRLSKMKRNKEGNIIAKNTAKKLRNEMRAETQRQRDLPSTAPGMGGQSYNQYVDRMVQDRSPKRRGKPGGIGGKELMAQGGIADLWPR